MDPEFDHDVYILHIPEEVSIHDRKTGRFFLLFSKYGFILVYLYFHYFAFNFFWEITVCKVDFLQYSRFMYNQKESFVVSICKDIKGKLI
jgi:hypothetical protein